MLLNNSPRMIMRLRNWIKKTDIPAHKIRRLWKFKLSEVDEWVKSGKAAL